MKTLREFTDVAAVGRMLTDGGLRRDSVADKAELFAKAANSLTGDGADKDVRAKAFFVPGRIEVLGKHTDYCGGRSLVMAADRGFCMVVVPRTDAVMHISALDVDDSCEFVIHPDLDPTGGHWSNYPMTVARRVARNFPGELCGADIAFASDLPLASGMSSSSALLISIFLALDGVNGLSRRDEYLREIDSDESLAGYLGTTENGQSFGSLAGDRGVGTFGGSQDHTAILCCQAGTFSQYSYCPVRLERHVALPKGYAMAVAVSGMVAEKTGEAMEKYNRASRRASAVVAAWNDASGRSDPHIAGALAAGGERGAERIGEILAQMPAGGEFTTGELVSRFEQFYADSEQIIPSACDALLAGDVGEFSRQVARSQQLAETQLGNQIAETAFLARSAGECGAVAASAFGAGFGGSVWAMVPEDSADAVLASWSEAYRHAHPEASANASFFLTHAGPAALELS